MTFFGLRLSDDARVRSWLCRVDAKLKGNDYARIPFSGGIKHLEDGVYVFDISPLWPRVVGYFVLVPTIILGVLGASLAWGSWVGVVVFTGLLFSFVWNLFWTPVFYWFVVWLQQRRLLGVWGRVKKADDQVMRWCLYGTVRDP